LKYEVKNAKKLTTTAKKRSPDRFWVGTNKSINSEFNSYEGVEPPIETINLSLVLVGVTN